MSLLSCFAIPFYSLRSSKIAAKIIFRFSISLFGGFTIPFYCLGRIFSYSSFSFFIANTKLILCFGFAQNCLFVVVIGFGAFRWNFVIGTTVFATTACLQTSRTAGT